MNFMSNLCMPFNEPSFFLGLILNLLFRTYVDYKIMSFRPVSLKPQPFSTKFDLGMKSLRSVVI